MTAKTKRHHQGPFSQSVMASWAASQSDEMLRRRFHVLHSALRDEGYNPIEAVSLLAAALSQNEELEDSRLTGSLRGTLSQLASGVSAAEASVAFQQFLVSEARNGLGQYLTPLPVAELVADVVAHEGSHVVLDPFAGSGLLLERVRERLPEAELLAIEINPAVAAVARAVSRLSRHPIRVSEGDAFVQWSSGKLPLVDAVVTNPPFGAAATRVSREEFEATNAPKALLDLGGRPAELFGLELSVSALRDGGLLVIVLPQSVLTNTSWASYRADLFRRIHVRAVISLPEETFGPFKGVARACVLIASRKATALPIRFPYLRSRCIGYDDTGRQSGESDLPYLVRQLHREQSPGEYASIDSSGQFLIPPFTDELLNHGTYRLGDFADIFTGRTPPRGAHAEAGPHQLNVGGLAGSFVSWRPRARSLVSREFFERNSRAHLRVSDICMTAAAHKPRYIGLKVDLIDELPPEGAMASAEVLVIRLVPDAPITAVQLLFYLRSEPGYRQVQDLVRGSTAHLYPSDMKNLLIPALQNLVDYEEGAAAFRLASHHFRQYLVFQARAYGALTPGGAPPNDDDDS